MTELGKAYVRDQRQWLSEVKLEVGDRVMCIAKAHDGQAGWAGEWCDGESEEGDMHVGATGNVVALWYEDYNPNGVHHNTAGILIQQDGSVLSNWWYPFWCLVKIDG